MDLKHFCKDLFLSFKQLVGKDQSLGLDKTDACHRVGKALTGGALVAEQQNGLLHGGKHLLLGLEQMSKSLPAGNSLAPTAANASAFTYLPTTIESTILYNC